MNAYATYLTCSNFTVKKVVQINCTYSSSEVITQLGDPATQSWALIFGPLLGIACYGLLGVVAKLIRYVDFSRNFVLCQLPSLAVVLLIRFILGCVYISQDQGSVSTPAFLEMIYNYLRTAADCNLYLGCAIFLYLCFKVARQRMPLHPYYQWHPFLSALGISYFISLFSLLSFVQIIFGYAFWVIRVFYSLFSIVTFFALCCCSSPLYGQSSEPYVANARSRMLWTLGFRILFMYALNMREYAQLVPYYLGVLIAAAQLLPAEFNLNMAGFVHLANASDLVEPFLVVLGVFSCLPAFRSVLFGSQGYVDCKTRQIIVVQRSPTPPEKTLPADY